MKPLSPTQRRLVTPDGKREITNWTAKIDFSGHRKFNWIERIKIALGYELDINVMIVSQHTPGKYAPQIDAVVTELTQSRESVAMAKLRHAIKPRWGKVPTISKDVHQYGSDKS